MSKRPPTVLLEMEKTRSLCHGLGTYCSQLAQAIVHQAQTIEPVLYVPDQRRESFEKMAQCRSVHKWHRFLPQFAPRADVWHLMHQDSQYLPPRRDIPIVLTIHDLNFLHVGKSHNRIQARLKQLQKRVDRVAAIATVSEFSRQEILQHLNIKVGVQVIPNGADLNLTPATQPTVTFKKPFFLALGDVSPKKNFHVLVPLMRYFPEYELIIAGRSKTDYQDKILQLAKEHQVSQQVRCIGPVTDAEKIWLYRHCEAFLFPSKAEGFGLPVVEAMRCGRPVFLSRSTSLPEVGGPLAYYFDSDDAEHMAKVVQQGLTQYQDDPALAKQICAWSEQFSWEKAARAYIDLYHSVISL